MPCPHGSFSAEGVSARIGVSVAVVQTAVFIGAAMLPYFGLQLSDYWWMLLPLLVAGTLAKLRRRPPHSPLVSS